MLLKIVFVCLLVFKGTFLMAQELRASVSVNSAKIQISNRQVFETLQKTLSEFINETKWTDKKVESNEQINCSFVITINEQSGNNYTGTIQVQSNRPVYNTSYTTPILNINDRSFKFRYNEFDQFLFNPVSFESNLVSTIAFYVYIILGVDSDTFSLNGGDDYLKMAQKIALQAQQSGIPAWQNQTGTQNRFMLIDNLLSPKHKIFREIMYNYHIKGFDIFTENKEQATYVISNNLIKFDRLYNVTMGNPIIRLFLDAKADEIVSVFSGDKLSLDTSKLKQILSRISPVNSDKWNKIN